MRIAFLPEPGLAGVRAALLPLLPAGSAAMTWQPGDAGAPDVLVFVADGSGWREALVLLLAGCAVADARPAVLALVPRDEADALATALDLQVADAAGLPIDAGEVRARLAALVRRQEQAAALAVRSRAALRLAVVDPVTGLYNRLHLDTVLPVAIAAAHAEHRPLAVLMIDVDDLKGFNDSWGHAAGDCALRSVAENLQANLRPGDVLARFGGDEMAVILPDTDSAAARALAKRLVARVGSAAIDGDGKRLTISIGAAMAGCRDDAASLLARADAALYAAKRTGRNRVAEAA